MSKSVEFRLQTELKKLTEHYRHALDLIEKNNARIEQLEHSLSAVKSDREFLLSQIKHHRNMLQHPTSVDLQLYASARDVIRNPSK